MFEVELVCLRSCILTSWIKYIFFGIFLFGLLLLLFLCTECEHLCVTGEVLDMARLRLRSLLLALPLLLPLVSVTDITDRLFVIHTRVLIVSLSLN